MSHVKQQLDQIEAEMRRLSIWSTTPPEVSAFESTTPFFADTMSLEEWLQWVFVARFRALLDADAALPASCSIAPLAEETWKNQPERQELLEQLKVFDALFDQPIQ